MYVLFRNEDTYGARMLECCVPTFIWGIQVVCSVNLGLEVNYFFHLLDEAEI